MCRDTLIIGPEQYIEYNQIKREIILMIRNF